MTIGPAGAATRRPGGRIYYAGPAQACVADESPCAARNAVWSVAPNGSHQRFERRFTGIANLNNATILPALSHHGRLFVFTTVSAASGGTSPLFVVPETGGSLRQLSSPPGVDYNLRWSPNDRRIAFLNFKCCGLVHTSIWVVRSIGGAALRVATFPARSSTVDFGWAPDGRWITFPLRTKPRGPLELWAVSLVGSRLHQLTHLGLRGSPTFLWSAAGRLAVIARRGIFISDRRFRRLTRVGPLGAYDPVFSPNGAELAFIKDSPALATYRSDASSLGLHNSAIFVVRSDGRGLLRLSRGNHYDQAPAWSPDGRWISFSRDESLWVTPSNGGTATSVRGQALPSAQGYGPYNALSTWVP